MRVRDKAGLGVVSGMLAIAIAAPAYAAGPNYGTAWETNFGAQWHGKVNIQASYSDSGRHARQGYHRFTRAAGPSLDTGRVYTPQASSASDTRYHWNEMWVWDSPLWGDQFTTKYSYNFIWF